MPRTLKSVSKQYTYNTNYSLSPKRLESIIRVIENSRDNLNKANIAHIVIWVGSADFDKSIINITFDKALRKELETGYGYFLALEKSRGDGYHIHIMLTFSTGKYTPLTILKKAVSSLYSLDSVSQAMAIPRKYSIEVDGYTKLTDTIDGKKNYFHNLNDDAELKDSIYRYSYLAKDKTKENIDSNRLTQSKFPSSNKTKQEQNTRSNRNEK
jgi:hypothetical protein